MCTEFQLPPKDWRTISQDEALSLQKSRFLKLAMVAETSARTLGEHLRAEIDRTARQH